MRHCHRGKQLFHHRFTQLSVTGVDVWDNQLMKRKHLQCSVWAFLLASCPTNSGICKVAHHTGSQCRRKRLTFWLRNRRKKWRIWAFQSPFRAAPSTTVCERAPTKSGLWKVQHSLNRFTMSTRFWHTSMEEDTLGPSTQADSFFTDSTKCGPHGRFQDSQQRYFSSSSMSPFSWPTGSPSFSPWYFFWMKIVFFSHTFLSILLN